MRNTEATRARTSEGDSTALESAAKPTQALVGQSAEFLALLEHVSLAAPLNRPVLLIGERGTGKELIAERLHFLSKRWDRPYIKLNCAALAESLLESELFGYEPGAFTGATKRHPGRFELAHQGTLFLDELATMSMRVQEKLLRVLEYGEFERLGGRQTLRVDVRVVAATNANLPELAQAGQFRSDLLDRLAFDVITLPPLRARLPDIEALAEHYAIRMTRELGRECFAGFSSNARRMLHQYQWPGNVRELKNVIERAVYRQLDPQEAIAQLNFNPFASPYSPDSTSLQGEARIDQDHDFNKDPSLKEQQQATALVKPSKPEILGLEAEVAALEKHRLLAALQSSKGHQRHAADLLQLSYHQFRSYLRKHGIKARAKQV
jgi:psp operon transcriptional activator